MPRPITFFGTSQSLFGRAAFRRFSESPNGLTLTSDQVEKSEMDVSESLKKQRLTAGEATRFLLDINNSASSGDYKWKQCRKSHSSMKYLIKRIHTN